VKFTDPQSYDQQFSAKKSHIKELLAPFYQDDIDCFASPTEYYRMRAEFKVWHQDGIAHYAMFERGGNKNAIFVEHFPVACKAINELMPKLMAEVNASEIFGKRLFHAEFLATKSGDMLVSLIYHRQLDDAWIEAARALEAKLGCAIIGRARKQKVVLSRDYVDEVLDVDGRQLKYKQIEGSFSQPNAAVCEHMLSWAIEQSKLHDNKDLLELYCGNGNFSIALAPHYNKVLATEMAKSSIKAALDNASANNVDNLAIARLSAEEFTQAWNRERPFKRLAHIDLDSYDVSTIFVDPPRAGMDPDTTRLCQRFDRILYISCNPTTLVDNLQQLSESHTVIRAAMFDQFPYTDHIEAGVMLVRK